MALEDKIKDRSAQIGIIGVGYVGLPLAVEFASQGFRVVGIDIDETKVERLNRGVNYVEVVDDQRLNALVADGMLSATPSYDVLLEADAIFICVPTPFTPSKDPDISMIVKASEGVVKCLRPEQLIMLKSTTFPETTEKIVLPILEQSGLQVGEDFYLAFVPERIDPGNKRWTVRNTPVVVGGVTPKCTELACLLNQQIVSQVVPVSSPRVAEMEKLLENIFRSVNIALVNELALLCDRMGNIDVWEVIEAAATKPFGFMPFYPGPGIGGHCIIVDPYFLAWKAREFDFHTNFIALAAETNEGMPHYVFELLMRALNRIEVPLGRARILILGVAFKRDISDTRNSPALKVMQVLLSHGVPAGNLRYNDPFVPSICINGVKFESSELTERLLKEVDCVLILTDHSQYDYQWIVENVKLVVDTRNATREVQGGTEKVVKLGKGDWC